MAVVETPKLPVSPASLSIDDLTSLFEECHIESEVRVSVLGSQGRMEGRIIGLSRSAPGRAAPQLILPPSRLLASSAEARDPAKRRPPPIWILVVPIARTPPR